MKTACKKPEYSLKVRRSSAGLGLFAHELIPRGRRIVEYCGTVLPYETAQKRGGKYLFELNSRWTIDGSARANTARYINHSCRPNCETNSSGPRVFFYAKRNIRPGEELTYNYGKEYWNEHIKPHGCRCEKCTSRKVHP